LARFDFFYSKLKKLPFTQSSIRVLDVGSGDAWFAKQLLTHLPIGSEMTCWDTCYTPELINIFQQGFGSELKMTQSQPGGEFDLVLFMDVLEHIEDEKLFFKETIKKYLKSNGWTLVSVPAWPCLYTRHDELLNHLRRYKPQNIEAVLKDGGVQLISSDCLFRLPLIVRSMEAVRQKIFHSNKMTNVTDWNQGPFITSLIEKVLKMETIVFEWLSKVGLRSPGISWWGLCQKK
jgi:hypothetical protein